MSAAQRKPVCEYGKDCYRKNEHHLKKYYHPAEETAKQEMNQCHGFIPLEQPPPTLTRNPATESPKPTTTRGLARNEMADGDRPLPAPVPATRKRSVTFEKWAFVHSGSFFDKPKKKKGDGDIHSASDSSDGEGDAIDVSTHSWTYKRNKEEPSSDEMVTSDQDSDKKPRFLCNTPAKIIKHLFLVDMPDDFYSFYEFCESVNGKNPNEALKDFGLRLVGAFDVLSGDMKADKVPQKEALCHWRFYMDPPEMQTVLVGRAGLHYGYWRDEPAIAATDVFVAKNKVPESKFISAGANLFHVVVNHLDSHIRSCNPFEKVKAGKVMAAMRQWAEDRGFQLADSPYMHNRNKKVVAATFHSLGIVVPLDSKTDVGYRPLIETNGNLKKMCQSVMTAKTREDRENRMEGIEKLVNAANIANDECDFGNALELGIDLFCMGSKIFDSAVHHLLTTAYSLLNRPENGKIISAHLRNRKTDLELSVL